MLTHWGMHAYTGSNAERGDFTYCWTHKSTHEVSGTYLQHARLAHFWCSAALQSDEAFCKKESCLTCLQHWNWVKAWLCLDAVAVHQERPSELLRKVKPCETCSWLPLIAPSNCRKYQKIMSEETLDNRCISSWAHVAWLWMILKLFVYSVNLLGGPIGWFGQWSSRGCMFGSQTSSFWFKSLPQGVPVNWQFWAWADAYQYLQQFCGWDTGSVANRRP